MSDFDPRVAAKGTAFARISEFRGLDRNPAPGTGALAAERNVSARRWPLLAPRRARGVTEGMEGVQGLIAMDGLCWVRQGTLYVSGEPCPMQGVTVSAQGDKRLVAMGAYLLIFPDGVYYNTADPTDYGYIDNAVTVSSASLTPCDALGEAVDAVESPTPPPSPTAGDWWIDTSSAPHVLRRWSALTGSWAEQPSAYVKIAAPGIDGGFAPGDGVRVSGAVPEELNGLGIIAAAGYGWVILPGLLAEARTQTTPLTLSRRMPRLDFVVECGNRLWGCRYGYVPGEGTVNEICACALGDFKNWEKYQGLSTDSWRASRGCEGPWTGAVNYLGTPLFFKENTLETVIPSASGAHRIQTLNVNGTGIAPGAADTAAVTENAVYWLGVGGFYVYGGSLPRRISAALGDARFTGGCAGALAGLYYASVTDEDGGRHLFVYDVARGLWSEEDDVPVRFFCRVGAELYFADAAGRLCTVRGTAGEREPFAWSAETGELAARLGDGPAPGPTLLTVRCRVAPGERMEWFYRVCGEPEGGTGGWHFAGRVTGGDPEEDGYYRFPLIPRRSGGLRLRVECTGDGEVRCVGVTTEGMGAAAAAQ